MLDPEVIIEEAKKAESDMNFNIFELSLYLSIKHVLYLYSVQYIPKEVANRYKRKAIAAYKNSERQFEFWNEIIEKHVNINKKTEEARIKLHKLLHQENADKDEIIKACMQIISIDYEKEYAFERGEKSL